MTRKNRAMPLLKVREKFQVTLPAEVREKLDVDVGDFLEAEVKNGKLTLSPKTVIDREIALGLKDIKEGRFLGPFRTAKEAVRALRRRAR